MALKPEIANLIEKLGGEKERFLNESEEAIKVYIAAQGKGCLTVIGRKPQTGMSRVYPIKPELDYVKCLFAFCRGKSYDGYELDSGLTEPISNIVVGKFESLYAGNSAALSEALMQKFTTDETILKGLVQTLVDHRVAAMAVGQARAYVAAQITHEITQKATDLIVKQIKAHSLSAFSLGGHVGEVSKQAVGEAATATLAKTIAAVIVKMISSGMGPLLAKLLASAAFKTFIMAAIKKYVIAAVIGIIIKFIAVKLGISSTMAWAVVLLPLVIGFMAYEIYHFPAKLADKVSKQVRAELDTNFVVINESILDKMFASLPDLGLETLGAEIAGNSQVAGAVDELIAQVAKIVV